MTHVASSGECQKCGFPSCTLKMMLGLLCCAACRGQQIHKPQASTLNGVYLTPRRKESP